MNPAQQHDMRLNELFAEWLEERRGQPAADLIGNAHDNFMKINDFLHAALRSDAEKATCLGDPDLNLGAPLASSFDFTADYVQLCAAMEAISAGEYDSKRHPLSDRRTAQSIGMTDQELAEGLSGKLAEEYEGGVMGRFHSMDKTALLLRSEHLLVLADFYEELRSWTGCRDINRETLLALYRLENTFETVFAEYQGCGLDEYLGWASFPDIEEYLPAVVVPEREGMQFSH